MPGGGGGAAGAAAAAQHASIPDFMAQMMAAPQQRQRGESAVAAAVGAKEPARATPPLLLPLLPGKWPAVQPAAPLQIKIYHHTNLLIHSSSNR